MTTDFAAIQTYTQRVAREAIDQAARGRLQVPTWRPGTLAEDAEPGGEVDVRLDGDLYAIGTINATGMSMGESSRGLVLLHPPHGATIVNYISGSLYLPYEPTYTMAAEGNGVTTDAEYRLIGDECHVHGTFTLGSTSSITGTVTFTMPFDVASAEASGTVVYQQSGTDHAGVATHASVEGANEFRLKAVNAATAVFGNTGTGIPISWVAGTSFTWDITYRVGGSE